MRPGNALLRLVCCFALLAMVALGGCADDAGASDAAPTDMSAGEPVTPPDLPVIADSPAPPSLGEPCDPSAGSFACGPGGFCFEATAGVGVCSIADCSLEDLATSTKEDSCPEGSACGEVSWASDAGYGRRTFCFRTCDASAKENPCAAKHPKLACDPATILLTGHTEVCAVPACSQDSECGTGNPFDPKAECDKATSLCFGEGKTGAVIGDPCTTSVDCGADQYCYVQGGSVKDKVVGGYCTKVGCQYGGRWACPAGSSCFQLGAAQAVSICLATGCDSKADPEQDGCRDEAPKGAYDCFKIGSEAVCWVKQQ